MVGDLGRNRCADRSWKSLGRFASWIRWRERASLARQRRISARRKSGTGKVVDRKAAHRENSAVETGARLVEPGPARAGVALYSWIRFRSLRAIRSRIIFQREFFGVARLRSNGNSPGWSATRTNQRCRSFVRGGRAGNSSGPAEWQTDFASQRLPNHRRLSKNRA